MGLREDNLQLRRMARAVMQGELGREEYYRRRRRVIDTHAGDAPDTDDDTPTLGAAPLDRTRPDLPSVVTDPTNPSSAAIAMVDGVDDRLPARAGGDLWIGLVVVVIVVGVVWGLVALFMG